jgi:hypothetical protein
MEQDALVAVGDFEQRATTRVLTYRARTPGAGASRRR